MFWLEVAGNITSMEQQTSTSVQAETMIQQSIGNTSEIRLGTTAGNGVAIWANGNVAADDNAQYTIGQ